MRLLFLVAVALSVAFQVHGLARTDDSRFAPAVGRVLVDDEEETRPQFQEDVYDEYDQGGSDQNDGENPPQQGEGGSDQYTGSSENQPAPSSPQAEGPAPSDGYDNQPPAGGADNQSENEDQYGNEPSGEDQYGGGGDAYEPNQPAEGPSGGAPAPSPSSGEGNNGSPSDNYSGGDGSPGDNYNDSPGDNYNDSPGDNYNDSPGDNYNDYPAPAPAPAPTPYVPPTSGDPLDEDDTDKIADEWKNKGPVEWVQDEANSLAADQNVVIVSAVLGTLGLILLLITAQQMLENPDGCCGKICRCWVAVFRILCWPCRKICCCGGGSSNSGSRRASRRTHDMVGENGDNYNSGYSHDLELT